MDWYRRSRHAMPCHEMREGSIPVLSFFQPNPFRSNRWKQRLLRSSTDKKLKMINRSCTGMSFS